MLDLIEDDPFRSLSTVLLGQVLPGTEGRQYPLRERLGEGGQGWVFRATWNGGVDVVVKVLRPDAASTEALARFQREADVLRMLSLQPTPNPHVVRFLDHAYATVQVAATGKSWNVAFTVLELVDGETLEAALERSHPRGIGLERARRLLRHVVLALQDIHGHGIVHRDLKPSNILLASPGPREIAKVTDFGLAKLLGPGMQRTTNLAGATVGYAPPEQFEDGNHRVGAWTDVFSLAAVFYEMVCGQPAFPFRKNDHPLMVVVRILTEARPAFARVMEHLPRELSERPDVIAALDAELFRALSPEPAERHATVADLHQRLEAALQALGLPLSVVGGAATSGVVVSRGVVPGIWAEAASLGATKAVATVDAPRAPGVATQRFFGGTAELDLAPAPVAPPASWQHLTPAIGSDTWIAVAVAAAGNVALGVGHGGPGRWRRGGWSRLDLPAFVDGGAMRAAAWYGDGMVLAGASPFVSLLSPGVSPVTWRFEQPAIAFHGAFADATGILLAGERASSIGPIGVIAVIAPGGGAQAATFLTDVPGSGPLRAVTRVAGGVLACGDGGALVEVQPGAAPRLARLCQPALNAVLALPDGTALTVGGGGFAFRIGPGLAAKLDAIQTTRDLFALGRAQDGTVFCGGAGGRILRRDGDHWTRLTAVEAEWRVRALHGAGPGLLAFADDGTVIEGRVR